MERRGHGRSPLRSAISLTVRDPKACRLWTKCVEAIVDAGLMAQARDYSSGNSLTGNTLLTI